MRIPLLLLVITGLLIGARLVGVETHSRTGEESTMALGFVLLASFLLASYLPRFKLPMITGYMLAGVLLGPYLQEMLGSGVRILSQSNLRELALIDHIALGLIAFTAGGELKLALLKRRWKSLMAITVGQCLVGFLGVAAGLYWLGSYVPVFCDYTPNQLFLASLLLASTAIANSPATTIAVINETRSQGPVTEVILGVTVVKDMAVIGFFALVLAAAKVLAVPGRVFDSKFLVELTIVVGGSLLLGLLLGWLLGQFIERIGEELPLVLLGVAFLAVYVAEHIHLHGLLICMTAGFVVENFTPHGEDFIEAVERYSLPIYVVFFTLAGATMNLSLLGIVGWAATLLVALRLLMVLIGTALSAHLARSGTGVRRYAWLGFVGQAGVTLGFAVIIGHDFPVLGKQLSTIIVAGVGLNQLLGPPALRWALARVGEVGAKDR